MPATWSRARARLPARRPRLLTETAIAQHAHARTAVDLLLFLGAGVALLGLLLAVDLIRFRARHTAGADTSGG